MSDSETAKPTEEVVLPPPNSTPTEPSPPKIQTKKNWVKFDEDRSANKSADTPAVINTESVQVNIERSLNRSIDTNNVAILDPKPLRNVELPVATVEPIRQGFIQLTVEEYVQALELLVNDVRFSLYNVCYKRVLVCWITLAFIVLLGLLFSGLQGLLLFGLGIGWLLLNAAAIFLSMYLKFKLQRNLEKCMANVNKQLLRHKIVLALDDRGKISCHKVTLCFIYMDSAPCIAHLQTTIDQQERDQNGGWEQRMDISAQDIIIQGSRTTRLSRKQERATLLYLRYAARWGRDRARGLLNSPPASGGRHCPSQTCPCQFIEEHLLCKPPDYPCKFCIYPSTRADHQDPYLAHNSIGFA
uniref:Transmembrane protein 268 n=1 Tax=Diabrotica virgifera virgifera TaxID=50390 RepID=A0A6P7FYT9_DIAVI